MRRPSRVVGFGLGLWVLLRAGAALAVEPVVVPRAVEPVVVPLAIHLGQALPAPDLPAMPVPPGAVPPGAVPARDDPRPARDDPRPVRDDLWVNAQLETANRLMAPANVRFVLQGVEVLDAAHSRLETRADRDALGGLVMGHARRLPDGARPKAVDVFIVELLRDVDEPPRLRMGVHWRQRKNRQNRYVILAASAGSSVLAHELGHYFGNPHTDVVDNVMSYRRSDPAKMAFDEAQLTRIRRAARQGFGPR